VTAADGERIQHAIAAAEAGGTGRIAVRIVPDSDADALARAKAEFLEAGLHEHESRNGALILVAPRARSFAILGDCALHERVGDAFWAELVAKTQPYFARGRIADGIVFATERIGDALRAHFPGDAA
jgi:uncharacterized membrane protein